MAFNILIFKLLLIFVLDYSTCSLKHSFLNESCSHPCNLDQEYILLILTFYV